MIAPYRMKIGANSYGAFPIVLIPLAKKSPLCISYQLVYGKYAYLSGSPSESMGVKRRSGPNINYVFTI